MRRLDLDDCFHKWPVRKMHKAFMDPVSTLGAFSLSQQEQELTQQPFIHICSSLNSYLPVYVHNY